MDTTENSNQQHIASEIASIRQRLSDLEQQKIEIPLIGEVSSTPMPSDTHATFIIQDGIVKVISRQMCHLTGYQEKDLIEASPFLFVLPEDRAPLEKHLANESNKDSPSVYEFRILKKDASIKWVIASISNISLNGSQASIANVIDINDHKQSEESNRISGERYFDLCENISDMILCVKPAGEIIYVNRTWRELLGYNKIDITNLNVLEILPKDYRENYRELTQQVLLGEHINDIETVLINKGGKRVPVEGSINCRFIDGKPDYFRMILHDVTKRKKEQAEAEAMLQTARELNSKLKQSNRELEDFAHIASHDLREPLRKIGSFGDLLKESLTGRLNDDENENLEFMIDGAKRIQLMIDDLLAYSQITTTAKPFQSVDPNKVIEDLKKIELASILEETNGRLMVPRPLLVINGDPSQIYQLFQNLILNAFKFSRDGVVPSVTVKSLPVRDNKVQFYIQDNGIGIEQEYHEQIFTMFKRLHSREKYKGTGIGLAICKKITQRHGGEIGVKSKAGEGSIFWFTLPRFADGREEFSGGNGNDK